MENNELNLDDIFMRLNSIAIFKNIFKTKTMSSLYDLLKIVYQGYLEEKQTGTGIFNFRKFQKDIIRSYAEFASNVYRHGGDFTKYVRKIVFEDKNVYITSAAQGILISDKMQRCLEIELHTLTLTASLTSETVLNAFYHDNRLLKQRYLRPLDFLPQWNTSPVDLVAEYKDRIKKVHRYGYGIYSKYYMFIIKDGEIVPVKNPDIVKLSDLIGYKRQRDLIIENTLALINGKPSQNVLLTGDAGTGKSSTIKAIVNEYHDKGIRIIEIRKDQLRDIPMIIDDLSRDPLKFIIFIDDLTFAAGDENFGTLKAILEGSVSARAENIVIYATSNRRHLVKENFSDRDGDDIHRNDTVQELVSLSERFGLHVTFSKPDKNEYLNIVKGIAKNSGIDIPEEELALRAEQFAAEKSGRSARAAKQFVDMLIAEK